MSGRLVPKIPHFCEPDEESMSLLALCEALHMVASGSVPENCMRKHEVVQSLNDLREKLAKWAPSQAQSQRYDDAVKELVLATIAEWKGRV